MKTGKLDINISILKFNNISKIYTNNIILNSSDEISDYQWFGFQLKKIAESFKPEISIYHHITGTELNRQELGNLINKRLSSDKPIISDSLKKYGLIPKYNTSNLNDRLGGIPKYKVFLNIYNNDIEFKSENTYLYQDEIKDNTPTPIKYEDKDKDGILSPMRKGSPPTSPEKSIKGASHISDKIKLTDNADPCIKGRLQYYQNKCYMDTILTILLMPSLDNKIGEYLLTICQSNLQNPFCKIISNTAKNIQENYRFKASELVETLRGLPGEINKAYRQYAQNRPNDTIEFLNSLLDLCEIKFDQNNKKAIWYTNSKGSKIEKIEPGSRIPKSKLIFNSELPFPLSEIFSDKLPGSSLKLSELLDYSSKPSIMSPRASSKYGSIITNNIWELITDKEITSQSSEPIFKNNDNKLLYFNYSSHKDNSYNYTINLEDDTFRNKSSKKIIGYFNIKQNYERRTINNADFMILTLRRTENIESRDQFIQRINLNIVIPDEQIELSNKTLNLSSIVTFQGDNPKSGHYYGFYKCQNNWYLYNDLGETTVIKIGNYQKLLDYNNNWVVTRGVIFIYC